MSAAHETQKTGKVVGVILNWNRPWETLGCLEAAINGVRMPCEWLVVDNASQDLSIFQIKAAFPNVQVLVNPANLGYAGGNNRGLRYALQAGAEFVLLLNDDTRLLPGALAALVQAAAVPGVAAVGAKVRLREDPTRLWAAGESLQRCDYPLDDGRYDTRREVGYAAGCCLLLKAAALRQVGLLNPDFFMVHEEREWCYRARRAGLRILYEPAAVAEHPRSFTSGGSPLYHYLAVRNDILIRKLAKIQPYRRDILRHSLLTSYLEVIYLYKSRQVSLENLWAILLGWLDGTHGRYGPPPMAWLNPQIQEKTTLPNTHRPF